KKSDKQDESTQALFNYVTEPVASTSETSETSKISEPSEPVIGKPEPIEPTLCQTGTNMATGAFIFFDMWADKTIYYSFTELFQKLICEGYKYVNRLSDYLEDTGTMWIDEFELDPLFDFYYPALIPPLSILANRSDICKKFPISVESVVENGISCGKNVEILNQANPLGTVSNLPLTDPKEAFQSTGISPLIDETFVLSSPPIQMEGIRVMATQQVKTPLKPLVYLTCKHIIHYNCIDNPQKLCPICPSTDMEPEEEEEMSVDSEEQPDTSSKNRSNEEDSPILKKLIKELSAPISQQSSSGSIISLQTFPDMDINSVNFRELDDKIINAEDGNKKTILE
ncbi:8199_t:CDS:2, partial [Racocetra fulgida]